MAFIIGAILTWITGKHAFCCIKLKIIICSVWKSLTSCTGLKTSAEATLTAYSTFYT